MYPISGAGGERVRRRDSGRRENDRRGQCQGVPAAKKGPDGWRVCQSVVRVWEGGRAVGFICMAFVSFVYRLVELVVLVVAVVEVLLVVVVVVVCAG
jgi:hypothetical protein